MYNILVAMLDPACHAISGPRGTLGLHRNPPSDLTDSYTMNHVRLIGGARNSTSGIADNARGSTPGFADR